MKAGSETSAIAGGGDDGKVVAATLGAVRPGAAAGHGGLAMLPLLGAPPAPVDYLTLAEGLASGMVRVTEVSGGGRVPDLAVANDGKRPVLIVDGEELVGAKQNRVVNLSLLVPGRSKLVIPVSCVEQGRWSSSSEEFADEKRVMFTRARGRKAGQVTRNLERCRERRSDQGEVWDDVAGMVRESRAVAPTGAMRDAYEAMREKLDGYGRGLRPVDGQCGAVFTINGRVAGLDLFDRPETWAGLHDKLVGSYAVDAAFDRGRGAGEDPAGFLREVAAAGGRWFDAVGMGRDVRLAAPRLSGGGLELQGRLVHLCAFRVEEAGRGRGRGFASPRQRELWYRVG